MQGNKSMFFSDHNSVTVIVSMTLKLPISALLSHFVSVESNFRQAIYDSIALRVSKLKRSFPYLLLMWIIFEGIKLLPGRRNF